MARKKSFAFPFAFPVVILLLCACTCLYRHPQAPLVMAESLLGAAWKVSRPLAGGLHHRVVWVASSRGLCSVALTKRPPLLSSHLPSASAFFSFFL